MELAELISYGGDMTPRSGYHQIIHLKHRRKILTNVTTPKETLHLSIRITLWNKLTRLFQSAHVVTEKRHWKPAIFNALPKFLKWPCFRSVLSESSYNHQVPSGLEPFLVSSCWSLRRNYDAFQCERVTFFSLPTSPLVRFSVNNPPELQKRHQNAKSWPVFCQQPSIAASTASRAIIKADAGCRLWLLGAFVARDLPSNQRTEYNLCCNSSRGSMLIRAKSLTVQTKVSCCLPLVYFQVILLCCYTTQ